MTTHTDHPLRHWDRTCPACAEITDLQEVIAGHPLAMARLREMQAVVEAAVATYSKELDFVEFSKRVHVLQKALKDGGWIE